MRCIRNLIRLHLINNITALARPRCWTCWPIGWSQDRLMGIFASTAVLVATPSSTMQHTCSRVCLRQDDCSTYNQDYFALHIIHIPLYVWSTSHSSEEALYGTMTVLETFVFVAALTSAPGASDKENLCRVDDILRVCFNHCILIRCTSSWVNHGQMLSCSKIYYIQTYVS